MRSYLPRPHRRRRLLACLAVVLATALSGKDALSQNPNAVPPAVGTTVAPSRSDPVKDYLWQVYQRSTVKKDGSGEFTWKDIDAAKHAGLSMEEYTIGGIDPDFRELVYAIGQAMDAAGVEWSILSGYRDDYRQNLASGFKSHGGYSFHGGSTATGGYGHGCAMDISSPDRLSDDKVWAWFDQNSRNYGLRRPLPATDPVHIQPLLGPAWHEKAAALRHARLAASGTADPTAYPTSAAEAGVTAEQWGCVRPKGQETAHAGDKAHHPSRLADDKATPPHEGTEYLYKPNHLRADGKPQHTDTKRTPHTDTKPLALHGDTKPAAPRGEIKPAAQRGEPKPSPQHKDAKPGPAQGDKANSHVGTARSGTGT